MQKKKSFSLSFIGVIRKQAEVKGSDQILLFTFNRVMHALSPSNRFRNCRHGFPEERACLPAGSSSIKVPKVTSLQKCLAPPTGPKQQHAGFHCFSLSLWQNKLVRSRSKTWIHPSFLHVDALQFMFLSDSAVGEEMPVSFVQMSDSCKRWIFSDLFTRRRLSRRLGNWCNKRKLCASSCSLLTFKLPLRFAKINEKTRKIKVTCHNRKLRFTRKDLNKIPKYST